MKLSRISLAILPLLSLCSVQAAVYNVVEIEGVTETSSTYAAAINDNGDVVFNGAIRGTVRDATTNVSKTVFQYYKFPIRLEAIDFENENVKALFSDEQYNELTNGTVTADTLAILLSTNPSAQPIGFALGYVQEGAATPFNLVLRDTDKTRTNSEYVYDINNQGVVVGFATAPYDTEDFLPAATDTVPEPEVTQFWVPQQSVQLGKVVINNQVSTLMPAYQEYGGGYSFATSISETGIIAGYGSVSLSEESIESIESTCSGEKEPVNLCLHKYHVTNQNSTSGYTERALLWQIIGDEIAAPQVLGFLGDKNSQQEHNKEGFNAVSYYSKALAVNDSGLAVGKSVYSDSDITRGEQVYSTEHATLFTATEALPMIDAKKWIRSSAFDINDNDIAIGTSSKYINGTIRNKLFYFDYQANKTVEVAGFFSSSDTSASAINNSNQVVGRGEVIIGGTTDRREHGYIYDIQTGVFKDLNDLISCASPYSIVDAKDINNNGVILATALVKKPQLDLYGEPVLDTSGNPVLADMPVVVKLEPIANGEPEDCSTEQTEYARQGGSLGFGAFMFGVLLWLRRKI